MIEYIKIAVRKQKKLIAIFLLTIFLPSVSLSIFGIRSIRNEKFRLEKQIENEHRRIANIIKSQINSRFQNVEVVLQNVVHYPSFAKKDIPSIKEILNNRLHDNPLIEQIFILYRDENPVYPLLQPSAEKRLLRSSQLLNDSQQEKLKRAQECEFQKNDYRTAISLYRELLSLSTDQNTKAEMLNHMARNQKKLGDFRQAVKTYLRIVNEYPESTTPSRLPLALTAELQIIDSYQKLGDSSQAIKQALLLYGSILENVWNLDEDQFKTYASLVQENVTTMLNQDAAILPESGEKDTFQQLKKLHEKKILQWHVCRNITEGIVPDLRKKLNESASDTQRPLRLSQTVDNRNFLISAVTIPDEAGRNPLGLLGIKLDIHYLLDVIVNEIIENIQFDEETKIAISDLSGEKVWGDEDQGVSRSRISEYFDDNFPPWKIEISRTSTGTLGVFEIHKNFYFWTILTLMIILSFGAVLIVKTVAHERELLKIKSDFVSSVSHELKTPLTSIKALTERLLDGKVKSPTKMKEYFSVISQDTDKLTRLVKNVLDFSKIEEGKKEYNFEETNMVAWLTQTIDNFRKDRMQEGIKIHTQIENEIPPLLIDQDGLSRSLNNLLDNALKFSQNKKDVEIRVRSDVENVVIQVKDNGIGIPQDELSKIFDKFYQGRNALRQTVKGTGLGLTLVKHAVEAHGGTISVESKVDQGTTFSLILPLKRK
ncbi:MAG: ATP-binding protein [bacterium]